MIKIRIKEARRHYREKTGVKLTQRELAEAVMDDYKGSTMAKITVLNRMQAGKYMFPNLDLIRRIAEYCGVDYNFLLNNE